MTLRSWKPIRKNSLIGFASVTLPIGLEIDDIAVLMTAGKAWASLPAKPCVTKAGTIARLPGSSKPQYVAILRWRERELSQGFSERVVDLIRERDPAAFDDAGRAP
jgi:hypothetical protein